MKVLTVYAHPNPNSFTHALLEEFTRGLADGGHEADVLDLYALKFDPVFTEADMATWLDPRMPPDILESMNPRQRVLDGARGPIQRFLARRLVRGKDNREVARFLRDHVPKDAARHWQHVADADALAFIAPVFWLSFPAILKGWHERVLSYGNAFALDRSGWEGQVSGRIGLLEIEDSRRRVARMVATMALVGDAIADDLNKFNRVVNLGHELARWFEAQFGSTQCRTLTGSDFATAEGVHAYIAHDGTFECARIARLVAERVGEMIAAAATVPANGR